MPFNSIAVEVRSSLNSSLAKPADARAHHDSHILTGRRFVAPASSHREASREGGFYLRLRLPPRRVLQLVRVRRAGAGG